MSSENTSSDILLYNGTFITQDDTLPIATALAIKGQRILWVGEQSESRAWIGPGTRVIDIKRAYGYPGFIDSHAHILHRGKTLKFLNLQAMNKATLLQKISSHARTCAPGEWIAGTGWDEAEWPHPRRPHAADLDAIAPHNPVVLIRKDTHLIWANSSALKDCGIDAETPDPVGGIIERDRDGNPTGILLGKAIHLLYSRLPPLSLEQSEELILEVLKECLQKGITMVHDASVSDKEAEVYKFLASQNALKVRIYMMGAIRSLDDLSHFLQPQTYSPFLEMRCLKLWMDGALGSRGAALKKAYQDDASTNGLLYWNEADVFSVMEAAKSRGFQMAVHAIGDLANHQTLNLYEKLGVEALRWRIEHAQLLQPEDVSRFGQEGVIASMQPLHAIDDMPWIEERIGNQRCADQAFMWRDLLDTGAIIASGSDAPVADFNPLWGIHAAITRQDHQGLPADGWYPKQKMTRNEAIKSYTLNAAYACFRENELGSLTKGKLADIVILPENLMTCDPKKLLDMQVIGTFVNGILAYSSGLNLRE
ncbi:MAG: amidohydrolase family protein [Parachlamydiales bacterium]|jgi:hypothetical protein